MQRRWQRAFVLLMLAISTLVANSSGGIVTREATARGKNEGELRHPTKNDANYPGFLRVIFD